MDSSIGHKIQGIFGVAAFFSLLGSAISYRGTTEMIKSADWVSHSQKVYLGFHRIRSLVRDAETGQRGFLITGEERYLEPYQNARKEIERTLAQVKVDTEDNSNQQRRLVRLQEIVALKMIELAETIGLRRDVSYEAARKVVIGGRGKDAMDQITILVNDALSEEEQLLVKRSAENIAYANEAKSALIVTSLLGLVMFCLMGFYVKRSVINPLREVVALASAISNGNLRQKKIEVNTRDEIGELAKVFNHMIDSLKELASQNISISRNLSSATAEVSASIQQQAAATKQQAASIQETTSTMEEIARSGAQIAERAREIAGTAGSTTATSASGLESVKHTNATMLRVQQQIETVAENIVALSERNQAIGEIISQVTDIAEQSNLLALNAAIEAAAAGEQGQSFSIVASEIKSLAEQAKTSTIQIRSILNEIQKGIAGSVMMTEEAVKRAESCKVISETSERTIRELAEYTDINIGAFQQIVGATNQQQIGFEQITTALKTIRQGAEQTAVSTGQLENAALSMNSLGQRLQTSVEKYLT